VFHLILRAKGMTTYEYVLANKDRAAQPLPPAEPRALCSHAADARRVGVNPCKALLTTQEEGAAARLMLSLRMTKRDNSVHPGMDTEHDAVPLASASAQPSGWSTDGSSRLRGSNAGQAGRASNSSGALHALERLRPSNRLPSLSTAPHVTLSCSSGPIPLPDISMPRRASGEMLGEAEFHRRNRSVSFSVSSLWEVYAYAPPRDCEL